MGLIGDFLSKGVEIYRDEIAPLRGELIKAGIIQPDKNAFEQKASLVDPFSYNMTGLGYKEKYSILDYSKCRQITYVDPIVASILQTRTNQVAAFSVPQQDKYKVGYKIVLRDKERKPTAGEKKRAKELEAFMSYCGVPENFEDTPLRKRRDSFETFLRKICRDTLTFDQINFEITPRRNGKPYSFQAVDAASIRIIPDKKEQTDLFQNELTETEYNSQLPKPLRMRESEFDPAHPKYAQLLNGVVSKTFDEWEMAFGVRNPRTDLLSAGYGFGEVEMMVATITSHLNAETYNRRFFSQGASVKGILAFEGTIPPDQLEMFRRQWHQQVSGVNNAWKTPIVSMGKDSKLNWQSLHSTNREMEFGKWLEYCIKTICGVYQIDPIEIGFDIAKQGAGQQGGGTSLSDGSQKDRILYSQDKGLRPLLRHIQTLLNEYIIYRIDPNFEFEFVGLAAKTEKDELDQAEQQIKTFKTINEIRAEHDLKPLGKLDEIESPGDLPLNDTIINIWSNAQAQAQAEGMMGEEGAMEGDPEAQAASQMNADMGQDLDFSDEDLEGMDIEELARRLGELESAKSLSKPTLKKSIELEL